MLPCGIDHGTVVKVNNVHDIIVEPYALMVVALAPTLPALRSQSQFIRV